MQTTEPTTYLAADAITTAALALGAGEGWVRLATLRQMVAGTPQATQDAALRDLTRAGELMLAPAANQKVLTQADRAAAVRYGNEDNHLIRLR